jgi:hypothetical protein
MARNRFDRGDYFFVGNLVGGACETRVAPVRENGTVVFGVASQGGDQFLPFGLVQSTETHTSFSFQMLRTQERFSIFGEKQH